MTHHRPSPSPRPETQAYWDAAGRGELAVQRCNACEQAYFYPRPFCPRCSSTDVSWIITNGRGSVYSYVISHRPMPGYEMDVPYVIALIELDEGPRILTNLVGVDPDPASISLDMAVRVEFEELDDLALPQFRPI